MGVAGEAYGYATGVKRGRGGGTERSPLWGGGAKAGYGLFVWNRCTCRMQHRLCRSCPGIYLAGIPPFSLPSSLFLEISGAGTALGAGDPLGVSGSNISAAGM